MGHEVDITQHVDFEVLITGHPGFDSRILLTDALKVDGATTRLTMTDMESHRLYLYALRPDTTAEDNWSSGESQMFLGSHTDGRCFVAAHSSPTQEQTGGHHLGGILKQVKTGDEIVVRAERRLANSIVVVLQINGVEEVDTWTLRCPAQSGDPDGADSGHYSLGIQLDMGRPGPSRITLFRRLPKPVKSASLPRMADN